MLYQGPVKDASENIRSLIPSIVGVIQRVNGYLGKEGEPEPSSLSKGALKALIWYVDGKRDNKSYYLLDGASLWSKLRIQILESHSKGSPPGVTELMGDLKGAEGKTSEVRDQLDGMAQIFVAGIKKIHELDGDIGANLGALRETAKGLLKVGEGKDAFLENTKDLERKTQELVNKYGV